MFENEYELILRDTLLEQRGQGLKILTPNQMSSRLAISLTQLKAGNNSEKLKNEIRQLLCSLYRSKKLTKSKTIEPRMFRLTWAYKLNLKDSNKNMALVLSIKYGIRYLLHMEKY